MYYIFFLSVCVLTHTEKKKKKIPSTYGQHDGRGCSMVVIYGTFNGFLSFAGGKKTKKSCGGAAGRRDDGGEVEPGRGMAGEAARMAAAGRLVVCRWSWWCAGGVTTIKVCYCTAFEAGSGGREGYFCTVATLHRRRRWIGSRGRVQLVML